MALDQSALLEVLEALKVAEVGDRVRTAAETIYQALIEAELTDVIGAAAHERSETRTNQRNGHRTPPRAPPHPHTPAPRPPPPPPPPPRGRSGAAHPQAAHRQLLPVAARAAA